jgi:DNA mismatch repair protein MutH
MNDITSLGQLVAVIQAQFATRLRPGGRAAPAAGVKRDTAPLGDLIELRVGQIAGDDPERGRKAFRVFLESVLLQELGNGLSTDPRFHQLVDDVQHTLETDQRCAPLVQDAITHLLGVQSGSTTKGKP